MNGLAIVLLAYVWLGMARLGLILYCRRFKDVRQHNDRLLERVREAGPAAILIGMAVEVLGWPYGLYLGYHIVLKIRKEKMRSVARRQNECKRDLYMLQSDLDRLSRISESAVMPPRPIPGTRDGQGIFRAPAVVRRRNPCGPGRQGRDDSGAQSEDRGTDPARPS